MNHQLLMNRYALQISHCWSTAAHFKALVVDVSSINSFFITGRPTDMTTEAKRSCVSQSRFFILLFAVCIAGIVVLAGVFAVVVTALVTAVVTVVIVVVVVAVVFVVDVAVVVVIVVVDEGSRRCCCCC